MQDGFWHNSVNSAKVAAFEHCDRDDSVGCMVVTGSEKAFAAGADIKEMEAME